MSKVSKPKLNINIDKITAVGGGLVNARTNIPAHFTVYTHCYDDIPIPIGTEDGLNLSIEGPSTPLPFLCQNNTNEGSVNVSWTPLLPGEYKVFIRYEGQNIKDSPFKVKVKGESIKAYKMRTKVKVSGEGAKIGKVNQENQILIDLGDKSISGSLAVSMAGPKSANVKLNLNDKKDGRFDLTYLPNVIGNFLLYVKVGEENVPGSPFQIKVVKE